MARTTDYVGKKYQNLTILSYAGKQGNEIIWKCRCDCGKELLIMNNNLMRKKVVSCGCLKNPNSEQFKDAAKKRIFSFIEIVNDCWIWIGATRHNGVAYTSYQYQQLSPVKYFYELENAKVPKNWCFKRTCSSPRCVNPKHHININVSQIRQENIKKQRKTNENAD